MRRQAGLERLEGILNPALQVARVPGAAVAVVSRGRLIYAEGFGWRDLVHHRPVTGDTIYPIASTTKAINATLLGILVEEGRLDWEIPVRNYLPAFSLGDELTSCRVTLRDLVTMQTGLPRHDWLWIDNPMSRTELVARLAHLDLSSDFRRRFQYSNLSVTLSGHIAEVVAGRTWEQLVDHKIFGPLGMRRTSCTRPPHSRNVTLGYHEDFRHRLRCSELLDGRMTAPSGGAVHSTVRDMAHWIRFNLEGGRASGRRWIRRKTLGFLHAPQILIGDRSLAGLPQSAAYAMGWVVHPYNGHRRLWHGGYHDDVNSSVMLFPGQRVGIVSFVNLGAPMLADSICELAFDLLMGLEPRQALNERLQHYRRQIQNNEARIAAPRRTPAHTAPSRSLQEYAGDYHHAAYGAIGIRRRGRQLLLKRNSLCLELRHRGKDRWSFEPDTRWNIHAPHAFDPSSVIRFHAAQTAGVSSLSIRLEPATAPIRFEKRR